MPGASARTAAYALAAVLAAAIAYDLWRTPIQVFDAIGEILDAQRSPSIAASFEGSLGTTAYLRPLRIAQIKAIFDAAQGHYQLAYRGFHVALLFALVFLFTRALRVESGDDLAAALFALTVLTGIHTFMGFVREAFPINHFLEIALCCLAALNLAQSRGGSWADVTAGLLFAFAALTLESGLLVWVVFVTAWVVGLRGVSWRGLAFATTLVVAYFVVRFEFLSTGLPALTERSAGFLFEKLDPAELQRRFGARPELFYAYNVAASLSSVLFSEPRDGVFVALRAWRDGEVPPRVYLGLLSSLGTTVLIAGAAIARWRRREFGHAERVALVGLAVIVASAALSFSYTKDDIMAVAGAFYGLAAFAAVRLVIERTRVSARPLAAVCASVILLALGSGWALRSVGVHHVLGMHVARIRNDWAELPLLYQREQRWPSDPAAVRLLEQLRAEALAAPVVAPPAIPEWNNRWFGD